MKSFGELRIVFIGTPEFAAASLAALVQAGANVVGVITVPDKPAGRGQHLQVSAVKEYALQHGLHLLQPPKLKDPVFLDELRALKADLQVVVAFRMLPEAVWDMPPLGTINVHASLLPQYRGAAPINWAIINGETETGVTTFKLKHAIDTGDILLQRKVPIAPEDNAGSLHDKLMAAGAELLVQTVQGMAAAALNEIPQAHIPVNDIRHAPKIFTEDRRIDWQQPAGKVHDFIRGLAPYPAATMVLEGKNYKVFETEIAEDKGGAAPGSVRVKARHGKTTDTLLIAAADKWLLIKELQQEGKKRMNAAEFLRGHRFEGL